MTYAITGITGKVGGELARTLLASGEPVRAVVRDATSHTVTKEWAALGCEVVLAEMEDASALEEAFTGATAVFILPPPEFDPEPGYPETRAMINSVVEAVRAAKPRRALCLSTIGADAKHDNLLSQRGVMEEALRELQTPLTILRPAWFIDNAAWDVVSARDTGLIHRPAPCSLQTRRSQWLRQRTLGAWPLNSFVRTGLAHAQSSWKGPAE
jgi:uncharacterized protein YbjT (DUF2867 family)